MYNIINEVSWLNQQQINTLLANRLIDLVRFYGISTVIGYLMPNPVFTNILNIYELKTHFVDTYLFAHSYMVKQFHFKQFNLACHLFKLSLNVRQFYLTHR